MMGRIAVSGIGAVTCLGENVSQTWENLCAGKSGLREISLFETGSLRNGRGGEIQDPVLDHNTPRSLQLLTQAIQECLENADLTPGSEPLSKAALSIGTNFGCCGSFAQYMAEPENNQAALKLEEYHFRYLADQTAEKFGIQGISTVVSTACASGLAVLEAALLLLEEADLVVCAGVDELNLYSYAGLNALRAISKDRVRPFSKTRSGTQFSEGVGAVILEKEESMRKRGAEPLAFLESIFVNNDAYHTTAPDKEGDGITALMEQVFAQTSVKKDQVGYLNAHGTGTMYNDLIETKAIKRVFGRHAHALVISSIKSMIGHAMGAAGIIECISTVKTLQTGIIPPTIGFEAKDEDLDLDYCIDEARQADIRFTLTNSYGIGGANASALLARE